MKLVITGGHHSSALPLIALIRKNYPEIEIFWIGHRHTLRNDKNDTLEYREITALGIPFYELRAGKFYKIKNPLRLLKIPIGFVHAFVLLKKINPDIVMSFGGYLAVPVVACAKVLNIPSITHEQTLVAGYANKFISKYADKVLVSWESSVKYFDENKVVYTGIPLRREIFTSVTDNFTTNNNLPTIFVMGGKTGSHLLNNLLLNSMETLLKKYNIIHQCGDYSENMDYQDLQQKYTTVQNFLGKYFLRKFILADEIGEAFKKSSLVISRSGAHTIAELIALNKPALLIPISWVSHNEQYENANYLIKLGLAEIINESEATFEKFILTIEKMFNDITKYKKNTETKLIEDSDQRILNEIIKLYKQKSDIRK